jgi:hypothetical protein
MPYFKAPMKFLKKCMWYRVINDYYVVENELNSCVDIHKVHSFFVLAIYITSIISLFMIFYNPLPYLWSWLAHYRKVPSWSAGLAACNARI